MARFTSFLAIFAAITLSFGPGRVQSSKLGVQPPFANPEASAARRVDQCGAAHFECPQNSLNADTLASCSLGGNGKLQCTYASASSLGSDGVLGHTVGTIVGGGVPSTDVCSYDPVTGTLVDDETDTYCRPAAIFRTAQAAPNQLLRASERRRYYIPSHPLPKPIQHSEAKRAPASVIDAIPDLKARVMVVTEAEKRGTGDAADTGSPNATAPAGNTNSNSTTFQSPAY